MCCRALKHIRGINYCVASRRASSFAPVHDLLPGLTPFIQNVIVAEELVASLQDEWQPASTWAPQVQPAVIRLLHHAGLQR